MFKNVQPYLTQFHVKELHIHFWLILASNTNGFCSRIWRCLCKHEIIKRGDFGMVNRFYVCFYSDKFCSTLIFPFLYCVKIWGVQQQYIPCPWKTSMTVETIESFWPLRWFYEYSTAPYSCFANNNISGTNSLLAISYFALGFLHAEVPYKTGIIITARGAMTFPTFPRK